MNPQSEEHLREFSYVIIALAAFITGILIGSLGSVQRGGSRIDWPAPPELKTKAALPKNP